MDTLKKHNYEEPTKRTKGYNSHWCNGRMKNPQVVYVADKVELLNKHYYRRLWIAARNMPIPRRAWLDEIADAFVQFDGEVRYRTGELYSIPLADDVFGEDADMRWMSTYLKSDPTNNAPLRCSRRRWERVRLIDLFFRVQYPDIARHFGR
ncbi:MAG: hypothetical protein HRT35_30465 [Algicola sp.]|nr:hypothetical protein [Algicola sp.]